jgi:hypothetical protein
MGWKLTGGTSGTDAEVDTVSKALRTIAYDFEGRPLANIATYWFYQRPRVTTGAATDFFDLFNATGSGKLVKLMGLWPIIEVTAASAIVPSFQFSLITTSAVGTGGTVATFEGALSPTTGLVNISRTDSNDGALPAQITARALPTGGATAARFLIDSWLITEDVNAASQLATNFNLFPVGVTGLKEVLIRENQGIKIRQITATASTGVNFGWYMAFGLY